MRLCITRYVRAVMYAENRSRYLMTRSLLQSTAGSSSEMEQVGCLEWEGPEGCLCQRLGAGEGIPSLLQRLIMKLLQSLCSSAAVMVVLEKSLSRSR